MPRIRINLNRDWLFQRGDHDPAAWQPVGLPHAFDLPYFRTPEFYVGHGEYKKQFHVPPDWLGKHLRLEFEGAFQTAYVYVNDRPVGHHYGGYTGFSLNITYPIAAGPNTLKVHVDNQWNPTLPPRAGEHIFSGGLYRDVYLVITDPLHVTWHGVAITTPQVSHQQATINVKTEIANRSFTEKLCRLVTTIFDPDHRPVATSTSVHLLPKSSAFEFEQSLPEIPSPKLWHPDHPHLYTVQSQVYHNDQLVDQTDSPFGIRWFQWTPDRGFFLNGEHLYLQGANAHQDHSGWGVAITQAACHRDVRLLKEAGFNFVRGSHYPHHPAFADACDRLGLIFLPEAAFWGKGGFGPDGYWNAGAYPTQSADRSLFDQHCKQMLTEMIRINRSHPSIVAWSLTNEAFFTYHLDQAKILISNLVKLTHHLDPTRPAAIGGAQRGAVDHLADIAAYNGDGARLFLDPGIPNLVSEYGAISKPIDAFSPFFGELQPDHFPWRSGQAIWCGFDYGSIAGRQGLKGILQHNRLPKQSWHWYRQELLKIAAPPWPTDTPAAALELSADKATITGTDATDDCQLIVTVLDAAGNRTTQSPPVTLTIDSGPGEFPTGRAITFDPATDIAINAGQAAIAFRSYHGGQSVIRATSAGLAAATLTITTIGDPQFIPNQTPLVPPRPYQPPPPSPAALAALKNIIDVARDRPSRASTEEPAHPARHANDADPDTFWQAAHDDAAPWLLIDLEGFYELSGYKLVFTIPANYRYRIETCMETSADAAQWKPAVDRSQTNRSDAIRNDVFDPDTTTRYVRLTFSHLPPGSPANLCRWELYGILSLR